MASTENDEFQVVLWIIPGHLLMTVMVKDGPHWIMKPNIHGRN